MTVATQPPIQRPLSENGRYLKMCDSCGAVDDHPKHTYGTSGAASDRVTYTPEFTAMAYEKAGNNVDHFKVLALDLPDDATQQKHLDCCLADGCPMAGTESGCDTRLANPDDPFDGGKTVGQPLVEKFEKLAAQNAKALAAAEKGSN